MLTGSHLVLEMFWQEKGLETGASRMSGYQFTKGQLVRATIKLNSLLPVLSFYLSSQWRSRNVTSLLDSVSTTTFTQQKLSNPILHALSSFAVLLGVEIFLCENRLRI